MKHAVLGATGDIGSLLTKELSNQGEIVTAFSRNIPSNKLDGVEYKSLDVFDLNSLIESLKGFDTVYSVLSVPYSADQWEKEWPVLADNLIKSAASNNFKLVFLDNVYMYGLSKGPMTEDSQINPVARKGRVRADIAQKIKDENNKGTINCVIARAADFYGTHTRISHSMIHGAFYESKVNWLGRLDTLRSFSYTSDIAKTLAFLGKENRADRQIWHVPTAKAMKGSEIINHIEEILGKKIEVVTTSSEEIAAKSEGAELPEIYEMMYQYEDDYVVDSTKIENEFGIKPTSYKDGLTAIFNDLTNEAA